MPEGHPSAQWDALWACSHPRGSHHHSSTKVVLDVPTSGDNKPHPVSGRIRSGVRPAAAALPLRGKSDHGQSRTS
eukprot:234609-Prymnesium_polylepis.2